MDQPLVSIICLNYNHAEFIEETINSVFTQTYPNIELIIVDDASSDGSSFLLEKLKLEHPEIVIIKNQLNLGNCKSFNLGYQASNGIFLIDLAADDVLMPDRVEVGVNTFLELPDNYGVHFTDAEIIDKDGNFLRYHYKRNQKGMRIEKIPEGILYTHLLERYLICTPTMMMKRSVLDDLNGYDETLVYEDFDFWVRSSKKWLYAYSDQVLVKKRFLVGSHSEHQYVQGSKILESTYLVCCKAEQMNETEEDRLALVKRVRYELRQAIRSHNYETAEKFLELLQRNDPNYIIRTLFTIWLFVIQ